MLTFGEVFLPFLRNMDLDNNKYADIDAILKGIFNGTLRDLFEKRVHDLGTNQTAILKILQMERRSLNGILDGTQKRADFSNLHKLAVFLNMKTEELIKIYVSQSEKKLIGEDTPANKKKFIRDNFDLIVLRKAGFINDITDFKAIEDKIVTYFGLKSIFEYKKRTFSAAFSAGIQIPKNITTRDFWLASAKDLATKLDNPYLYDRQELIKYFPQIRWQSTNEEFGLINVIKALFKIGITVIYQSPFSSLHLRGATFPANDQPCIVLTDYKGFYPTLWHCLIHELYHVLFDWDEIRKNSYHVSEDASEMLDKKEIEIDEFAREYLFSKTKLHEVKRFLRDEEYIADVAKNNHVHPSIIYIYNAFDNSATDRMVWARTRRLMPEIKKATYKIEA